MPRTTFGKARTKETPYAVYKNSQGWEWRVLKTYKHSSAEQNDPYARWFVAATSPHMHGGGFGSLRIHTPERSRNMVSL